jgi:hypothetical protein
VWVLWFTAVPRLQKVCNLCHNMLYKWILGKLVFIFNNYLTFKVLRTGIKFGKTLQNCLMIQRYPILQLTMGFKVNKSRKISKALTKQEGRNVCWDAPKNLNFWMIEFTIIKKKSFGKIGGLVNFIVQKLKSKHLSQLLGWEVNLRGLKDSFCRKFGPKRQLVKGGNKKTIIYWASQQMFRPAFCQGLSPKGFLVLFNMPIYFRWRRICCSYDASIGLALFRNLLQDRPEWRIRRCNHAFQTRMWSW